MGAAKLCPDRLVSAWDADAVGDEQQEVEEVGGMVVISKVGFSESELDSCYGAE